LRHKGDKGVRSCLLLLQLSIKCGVVDKYFGLKMTRSVING